MSRINLGKVVGNDGKSAYQIWLEQGNTGTEEDFLNSLNGKDGVDGKDGTNGQTVNVGKMGDTNFDTNTFIGALREAIEYILTNYPTKHILLISDTQRDNSGFDVNYTNNAGCKLIDYVNAMCAIGELYGIPVCNWYTQSGVNAFTLASYTRDGLHPNELGYTLLGNLTSAYVRDMYCNIDGDNGWSGKKFIAFGTSITAGGNKYLEIIKEKNGFETFVNAGASGKSMAGTNGINSIIHNTDIADYDLIIIESSTNDFKLSKKLGEIIEVEEVKVTGLSLNKTSATVAVGGNTIITASTIPTNATNQNVTWVAENNNVSISSNGLSCTVTGATEGTCNISCTTKDGGYIKTCLVTVSAGGTDEPDEPDEPITPDEPEIDDINYESGYLTENGVIKATASERWKVTNYIKVYEGQIYRYVGKNGASCGMSVAGYDNNKAFSQILVDPASTQTDTTFTIPSGVSYIVGCFLDRAETDEITLVQ